MNKKIINYLIRELNNPVKELLNLCFNFITYYLKIDNAIIILTIALLYHFGKCN